MPSGIEEMLHDLTVEQLNQLAEKHPQYKEDVEKEIEERGKKEEAQAKAFEELLQVEDAKRVVEEDFDTMVSELFPTKPKGIKNILVVWKANLGEDGQEIIGEDGQKDYSKEILSNVYWQREEIKAKPTSTNKGNKQEITLAKFDSRGNKLWEYAFDSGEDASRYAGVPKDKGSFRPRLNNRVEADGSWYRITDGVPDGVKHAPSTQE